VAAAAILLGVNLSAVLPATPSNVGVFQAACVVVLAAYGVGAGNGVAYGIILQAVEVLTALGLGVPALLGEGLRWRDIRQGTASAGERAQ
jgi:phosphatidylinositol alpha-mannosyltransferase